MGQIHVVTDSTAYLTADEVAAAGVTVVPVQVIVAGKSYREGTDIQPAQVAEALREWKVITTSRPTPADFSEAYEAAAAAGAQAVVSIHLSAEMSGTYESAVMAARQASIPVHTVDSRSVAMGMGFPVLAAARVAAAGATLEDVTATAEKVAAGANVLFYVDTLEFLRRGGRIGGAAALFGTALRVKPLLQILDGRVSPLEKARTANKAIARLADITVERLGESTVDVAVQHLSSEERARDLAAELERRLPGTVISVSEIGAVVGAHVGPGTVAVSFAPKL